MWEVGLTLAILVKDSVELGKSCILGRTSLYDVNFNDDVFSIRNEFFTKIKRKE